MSYFLKGSQVLGTLIYDIETVPLTETFEELEDLNPLLAYNWFNECDKMRRYRGSIETEDKSDQELYQIKAGLYPEYAKVVSASGGLFKYHEESGELRFYIKAFTSDDEVEVLTKFGQFLSNANDKQDSGIVLGGYNIKIFDNPMMIKRYAINGMQIPYNLNHMGKKPWEINDVDLADIWKIGSYDKFMKLDALAGAFGVKSSKEDLDGSKVRNMYYSDDEDRLQKIDDYCMEDTIVTAKIFRKLAGIDNEINFIKV